MITVFAGVAHGGARIGKLGINLGYWGAGNDADNLALAQEADRLGYAVAWAAEAYGSDAATILTWIAAHTERIDVGSAIFQIPARTPAMTAMTAATLDTLSGGRFRLGLGVSGPQVSEGWHGVRFDKPLARTREYVGIVRLALRRETVRADGEFFTLPLPDGPGKALKLTVHPVREHIPIYLAAVGPKNLELAGEIADGWLAIFFSPEYAAESLATWAPAGPRPPARTWTASTWCRRCRSWSATTSPPVPTSSAATRRCTSAAWAAGNRTSTTSSRSGWATTRRPRGAGPVPRHATSGARLRPYRWSSSTRRR